MRKVGMVLFPNLTQLDLTGPYEVFCRLPDLEVFLVAETKGPVRSDHGLLLTPDFSFDQSPQLDILFVPGGNGVFQAMQNERLLDYLKKQATHAEYISSVCTGSLILAAAGLLDGYQATTHWLSLGLLRLFDVEVLEKRVVIDRNRMTGGGVTAGIDFGLSLAAKLYGEDLAKEVQLMMEYDPSPPFHSGSPATAAPEIIQRAVESRKKIQQEREDFIRERIQLKKDLSPLSIAVQDQIKE
jgi:cyclohexyl-isocyanide hydratase